MEVVEISGSIKGGDPVSIGGWTAGIVLGKVDSKTIPDLFFYKIATPFGTYNFSEYYIKKL